MTRRELAAALMQAVYLLSTRKPHEASERGYTAAEWPLYCEGYYTALVVALRVLEAEERRQERISRNHRQRARAARQAAALSVAAFGDDVGKELRMRGNGVADHLGERGEHVQRHYEAMLHLRQGVPPLQFGEVADPVPGEVPGDAGAARKISHTVERSVVLPDRGSQRRRTPAAVFATPSPLEAPANLLRRTRASSSPSAGTELGRGLSKNPTKTGKKTRARTV